MCCHVSEWGISEYTVEAAAKSGDKLNYSGSLGVFRKVLSKCVDVAKLRVKREVSLTGKV